MSTNVTMFGVLISSIVITGVGCGIYGGGTDAPQQTPFENEPPGVYKFQCLNDNSFENQNYYWVANENPPPEWRPQVEDFEACAQIDDPMSTDPTEGGNVPLWDAAARASCTARCIEINRNNALTPVCEDENWSLVRAVWTPSEKYQQTCPKATSLLDFNAIEAVFGTAAASEAATLPCDLSDDCSDYLDIDEKEGLWTSPDSNTRFSADFQMESDPGESNVIAGASSSVMEGNAAYTATACNADACPFYLAQFELYAVSNFTVSVSYGSAGTFTKTISNLGIQLEQPTLGMWLPNSGAVILPPGSLRMTVSATLSGTTNYFGENGGHQHTYAVDEYVWGLISGTDLILATDAIDTLGSWSVLGQFVEE